MDGTLGDFGCWDMTSQATRGLRMAARLAIGLEAEDKTSGTVPIFRCPGRRAPWAALPRGPWSGNVPFSRAKDYSSMTSFTGCTKCGLLAEVDNSAAFLSACLRWL